MGMLDPFINNSTPGSVPKKPKVAISAASTMPLSEEKRSERKAHINDLYERFMTTRAQSAHPGVKTCQVVITDDALHIVDFRGVRIVSIDIYAYLVFTTHSAKLTMDTAMDKVYDYLNGI